jgi:hypothetical protein
MNITPVTALDAPREPCPTQPITVQLPLATVEELEQLAELNHLSRQEIVRQIITAGLLNDRPHLPTGPDPIERLAAHGYLTHCRSIERAAERDEP